MKNKKILPPTYFICSIFIIIILHLLIPLAQIINFPYNLIGLIPLSISGILNLWAYRNLRRIATTVNPFEYSTSLVITGVYRISRNPMYLGMTLFLLGESLLLGSLTPFFISIFFGFLMNYKFILVEEKMLEGKFQSAFINYRQEVRRWI
jgi:protein-S-isoprenylcysteine O-methyltransferase Ste14